MSSSLLYFLAFVLPIAKANVRVLYTCDPPCVHGSCMLARSDTETSSFCQCDPLWYGDACSEFICNHHLEVNPCRNGATCQPLANYTDYECQCAANYSGEYCTVSHFNCHSSACSGHGNCSDNSLDPSGYQCECDVGFSGSNCEENIDDCVGVDCNNGTCVDGISSYYCSCDVNYTGSHCEDVDYCAIHAAEGSHGCNENGVCCYNGGSCVNVPEEERYECACPPPWLPTFNCLRRAMLCADNPCKNGATCKDNGLEYTCTCPPGVTGKRCDKCADSKCQNGAVCSVTAGGEQHCQCLPYTTGEFCESRYDPCNGAACYNGGSCRSWSNGLSMVTSCVCPDGYSGQYCERVFDPCDNDPCNNGGTCINRGKEFLCDCPHGFSGPTCSVCLNKQFCDCPIPKCVEKANNGKCDEECNSEQCHWDNDECRLIKTEDPWSQCTVMVDGRSCQELFNNGVCDSECATAKCLLDGKDCLPKCPHRLCSYRFQNLRCNQKCNTPECLFDGGDCKSTDEVKLASGLLKFTIEMGRTNSLEDLRMEPFLVALGELLNCIPIEIRETDGSRSTTQVLRRWNMTVVLDVSDCNGLCISRTSEAKDILNAHYSRGSFPPYPYTVTHIYSQDKHKLMS